MKDIYSNILRWAITLGLYEREKFIDKLSELLSEKMDADPQSGERIAEGILSMAEALRDELLLRQLFDRTASRDEKQTPAGDRELIDKLDRLTRTLEQLDETLKKKPL